MNQKTDIATEGDIKKLVHTFYDKVNRDELLSPIFNEVAKVNWDEHLPLLCRFWSTLLFRTMTFEGRPFPKHVVLPIQREHFTRWVSLFVAIERRNSKFTGIFLIGEFVSTSAIGIEP